MRSVIRTASAVVFLATFAAPLAFAASAQTELISKKRLVETTSSNDSYAAVVSADGKYVAFVSRSVDLVAGDHNDRADIFVREMTSGAIERVSVGSSATESNADSFAPSISDDGRYVAFESFASNLIGNDTNDSEDVFVRDRLTGTTQRVSVAANGSQLADSSFAAAISADGHHVAFCSLAKTLLSGDSNAAIDIFERDLQSGALIRVSLASSGAQANADSFHPTLSADGRYAAFYSSASNLVAGDANSATDVFVHDALSGATQRISMSSAGAAAADDSRDPVISADGHLVAFVSLAANLVSGDTNHAEDVFVRDRLAGTTERVSLNSNEVQGNAASGEPALSADGRYAGFSSAASNLAQGNDTNSASDVFVRDRQAGTTERVSVVNTSGNANGNSSAPSISADGRYVAFFSDASNIVAADGNFAFDSFVRDRQANTTALVSPAVISEDAAGFSRAQGNHALSADGRFVVFESQASGLVEADGNEVQDVFVRDRLLGETRRVSVDSSGGEANGISFTPAISADGRFVAFESFASNLVSDDSNGCLDIFVHDLQTGTTERASVDSRAHQGNDNSQRPALSADGRYVAFYSAATNLVANDTNQVSDVFVHDRTTHRTERVSVDSAGAQSEAFGVSADPSISADGRFVAFSSSAARLVASDDNALADIFVHDRQSGVTERVSVTSGGIGGDDDSLNPALSADGRYVAFESFATNLVAGDTNRHFDVFLHDRQTGTTRRISVSTQGAQADADSIDAAVSADGRYVVFTSFANNLVADDTGTDSDIFLRDLRSGTLERISLNSAGEPADAASESPSLSADGRFVAFTSFANNLGPDINDAQDVYLRDRAVALLTEHFTLDPRAGLAFGDRAVNTKTHRAFTLTNKGADALSIGSISMEGGSKGRFSITHDCGAMLAAGASCSIDVVFQPLSAGAKHATLKVAAGQMTINRPVSGTGIATSPTFSLSPASIDFSAQRTSTQSQARTVTLRNTGRVPVAIQSIGNQGGTPSAFPVTHDCASSVAAGSSCTISVTFRPKSEGPASTMLRVLGRNGTPTHTVALSGSAIR